MTSAKGQLPCPFPAKNPSNDKAHIVIVQATNPGNSGTAESESATVHKLY